jgi:uncharacterized membrane protein
MDPKQRIAARALHRGAHYRLLFAALVGIGAAWGTPHADMATRSLVGWDIGVLVLLLGIWHMMATTTLAELRRKASQQDETAPIILALMMAAVVASLGGILAEMNDARAEAGRGTGFFILLALATLVLSWLGMHMLFAIHYAHTYYGDHDNSDNSSRGLIFPEHDPAPSYMEFVYFALCLGMTYQVSDIMTGTRAFRRLITLHSALSFFYNTFVLALAVNLFGGLR